MQTLPVAQPGDIGFREPDREMGGYVVIAPTEHFTMSIYPRQRAAVAERDVEPHRTGAAIELAIDQL